MSPDALALDHLTAFLAHREWEVLGARGNFGLYSPPSELGLDDQFRLAVPIHSAFPDFERAFSAILRFLADVYDSPVDDLRAVVVDQAAVFAARIAGRDVEDGDIRFDRFDALIRKLKNILLHSANYLATDDPLQSNPTSVAAEYLRSCSFMQTRKGSFISRVKLPHEGKISLKQNTIFAEEVDSKAVADRVINVFDFVAEQVLSGREHTHSDDFIEEHRHLLNIPVLKNVAGLLEDTGRADWDFCLLSAEGSTEVHLHGLTAGKMRMAYSYIDFVARKLKERTRVDVVGLVTEARSKNPRSRQREVRLDAYLGYRRVNVIVTLSPNDYESAVKAHLSGKLVRVAGQARKLQTRYRIDSPDVFEVVDSRDQFT